MTTLHHGDCLAIMQSMDDQSIDLIYADPPFNTGRDFGEFDDRWNLAGEPSHPAAAFALHAHSPSMAAYIDWMAERMLEMKRILKQSGSVYLHCDQTASHYLKTLLDCVFCSSSYRNEITWKRYRGRRAQKIPRGFAAVTDTLLFYRQSTEASFDLPFTPLDPEYVRRVYRYNDNDGNGPYRYGGRIRDRKYYLKNSRGTPIASLWGDLAELNGAHADSTGYPTQKPVALLNRIIEASSNTGDTVLDPFCGSGTTIVAATTLGRHAIGIDRNQNALDITSNRLKQGSLLAPTKECPAGEDIPPGQASAVDPNNHILAIPH